MLERSHFKHLQYCRHKSIEIHGIPDNVDDKNLEPKILADIGIEKIEPWQVHACHRLKNKKNTIIRLVLRKTADSALYKLGNFKKMDKTLVGLPVDAKLYINESLCPPYKFLYFKIWQLFKHKLIQSQPLERSNVNQNGREW